MIFRKILAIAVSTLSLGAALSVAAIVTPIATSPPAFAAATGFVGVTPARLLDTRDGTGVSGVGPVGAAASIDLQVTGRGGLPSTGVSAVVLNVTVANPTASSYVTVWPTGSARPTASNLNFEPGQVVPNLVIVKVGTGGKVSLYNNSGTVDLIADVSGYYTDGSQLVPTVPTRLLDTRNGTGGVTGPTAGKVDVTVLGQAGVPAGATSVVLNVTVTDPTGPGYLTVWPAGASQPAASNLNYVGGQTVPNLVITKIGNEGKISYYASTSKVNVIIDVLGYIANPVSMTGLLSSVAQSNYSWNAGTAQSQGQPRFNSLFNDGVCDISAPSWIEYNLGRQWSTLATTFTFDDVKSPVTSKVRFRILGDGVELVNKTVAFGQSVDVTANVAGVLRARFEVLNANVSGGPCSLNPTFADVRLSATPNAPFPTAPEFFPVQPSRILDSRDGTGAAKGRVSAHGTVELQVLGHGGIPTSGVGAVVMNVTATNADAIGYVTVWPTGVDRPLASNLNFLAGQSVANLVIVPVGANGRVSLYNNGGFTDLIADVLGWYPGSVTSEAKSINMTGLLSSVAQSNYSWNAGTAQSQGQPRFNSLFNDGVCDISAPSWIEYNLGRQWSTLATTFTFDDVKSPVTSKVRFRILGDGVELVNKTVAFGQSVDVTANVAGVLRLRFEVLNANVSGGPCSLNPTFSTPILSH